MPSSILPPLQTSERESLCETTRQAIIGDTLRLELIVQTWSKVLLLKQSLHEVEMGEKITVASRSLARVPTITKLVLI